MRKEKRILRKKMKRFHEEQIKHAENPLMQKESRRFYRPVHDIMKEFRPHNKACRDNNELILNETPMMMNRWNQYFQNLLGGSEMESKLSEKGRRIRN
jgi:hypothetical protein